MMHVIESSTLQVLVAEWNRKLAPGIAGAHANMEAYENAYEGNDPAQACKT
jgi:hypothetical protein